MGKLAIAEQERKQLAQHNQLLKKALLAPSAGSADDDVRASRGGLDVECPEVLYKILLFQGQSLLYKFALEQSSYLSTACTPV